MTETVLLQQRTTCEFCSTKLLGGRKRFCSMKCKKAYWLSQRIERECQNCHEIFTTTRSTVNRKFCDQQCRTEWKAKSRKVNRNISEIVKIKRNIKTVEKKKIKKAEKKTQQILILPKHHDGWKESLDLTMKISNSLNGFFQRLFLKNGHIMLTPKRKFHEQCQTLIYQCTDLSQFHILEIE